jgi:Fur family transcriptional regulator, peroxide stress response regulator
MTRQRSIILEQLRNVCTHPSADEIYEIVRKRLPRISLGTVYRNLEILCELGEIQKIETGGMLKRFDGNPEPHYHIRCIGCDRVVDSPVAPLIKSEKAIHAATDYRIVGHRFEFLGVCPICSKNAIAPGLKNARNLTRPSRL